MNRKLSDTSLGKLAVEKSLVTQKELAQCLEEQHRRIKAGAGTTLAKVMLDLGFVTRSQIEKIASDDDEVESRPSQQIPGFQIVGRLGAGHSANVFKARQLSVDRMTAVKVLPKKLGNNPHLVERFYREARTLSRLDHPNIVTVFDACEARGYHYMAMTYVDGFTLRERLERQGRLPEREVLPILLQVARALQHMHDCGYLHRNIIPSKVMASGSGRARLVGLGTSWEIRDLKAAMAEAGTLLGTPSYMSPEQIRGEVNIDPRSDIYGLGANLYHLVTGKRPFEGNTPAAIIHKHLKEPLNPPDHLCTAVSSATSRMVERMMAKQPEERYASMNEVAIEVEKLIR